MGLRSQRVGDAFEQLILWSAHNDGRLTLVKQHPEVRFFRGGRAKVVAKAVPDFMGWVGDRALGVVFDAKSTENKRRLVAPRDRRHQFEFMRRVAEQHPWVMTFYLVEWRGSDPTEFEVFPVKADSRWPFVMEKGGGLFSVSSIGDVWQMLISKAGRESAWEVQDG